MCSSALSCPLCCLSRFPDLETFKLNLIKVNSKPIKCPFPQCDEILLGLDKLTIHLFGHSLPIVSPSTSCQSTTQPTNSDQQSLQPVTTVKSPRQTKAKMAKSTISSSVSLSSHQTKSTSTATSDDPSFRCEICGFIFYDENLLNLHLSLVHNFIPSNRQHDDGTAGIDNNANNNVEEGNSSQANDSVDEMKKFHCHLCSKHFKMKGALKIHIRVAHVKFQDQNKRQINIANYLKAQKTLIRASTDSQLDECTIKTENLTLQDPHSPLSSAANSPASFHQAPSSPQTGEGKSTKTFQCEECKKTFTTKYFLKKHKRLHTGEMPYTCEQCGKTFYFQQSYHKHLNYHNDEKPYECTNCGRTFKELSTLHNHERIHSGVKPFGCEICGKFFRQRVSKLVHTRIHTGVTPFKCSECGKGFRYKVSLRSHKCSGAEGVEQQQQPESPGEVVPILMQDASISPTPNSFPTIAPSTDVSNVTTTNHQHYDNLHNNNFSAVQVDIPIQNSHLATLDSTQDELCLDDLIKDESYEKFLMKHNDNCMGSVIENQQQFIPIMLDSSENHFNTSNSNFPFDFHNNNITDGNNDSMGTISSDFEPLMSNFNTNFHHSVLETINEDSIKELLGAFR